MRYSVCQICHYAKCHTLLPLEDASNWTLFKKFEFETVGAPKFICCWFPFLLLYLVKRKKCIMCFASYMPSIEDCMCEYVTLLPWYQQQGRLRTVNHGYGCDGISTSSINPDWWYPPFGRRAHETTVSSQPAPFRIMEMGGRSMKYCNTGE